MRLTANAAPAGPTLERITINIGGTGKVRKEKLEGRQHLVVPTVLLREEVLNGSGGPIFYPHEENSKNVAAWNHMPIMIDHPEVDGTPVSARTPDQLNSRKVGVVLNAAPDDATKKIKAECWFDEALLKATDVRVYNNLLKEVPTESSTGLFLNRDPVKGKFGETAYDGVAREQTPDHLAVLPDKVGALSVKMGGGLFANAEREPEAHRLVEQRTAENALRAVGIEFVGNELSFNTVTRQLSDMLARTHGEKGRYWEGYVEDVFSDKVVFRNAGKTYQQEYTANDKGVSLKGAAVEVVRAVSYQPVGNAAPGANLESAMDKTAFVNWLISNGGHPEADRAKLTAMTDDELKAVKPAVANAAPAVPAPAPTVTLQTPAGTAVVVTRESVMAAMDPNDVAVLNYGKQQLAAQRTMLVNALKSTGRCKFSDDYIGKLPIAELQAMVELAGGQVQTPTTNGGPSPFVPGYYPGMPQMPHAAGMPHPAGVFGGSPFPAFGFPQVGGPVANYGLQNGGTPPTTNGKKDAAEDDDVLEPPVVNFGKRNSA